MVQQVAEQQLRSATQPRLAAQPAHLVNPIRRTYRRKPRISTVLVAHHQLHTAWSRARLVRRSLVVEAFRLALPSILLVLPTVFILVGNAIPILPWLDKLRRPILANRSPETSTTLTSGKIPFSSGICAHAWRRNARLAKIVDAIEMLSHSRTHLHSVSCGNATLLSYRRKRRQSICGKAAGQTSSGFAGSAGLGGADHAPTQAVLIPLW